MILPDRTAVVTGGGQGLGEAICRRLAVEGAQVVVADIVEPNARRVASAIKSETGRSAIALGVDVTNEEQVESMVDLAVQEFGRLDILVSNAGILFAE
jgi:NAD(P)-dependent dehydrogenase (short-subunit alcohol dehydrogenase family)